MRARLARHQNAQMVTGSPTVDGLVPIGLGSHPVILPVLRSANSQQGDRPHTCPAGHSSGDCCSNGDCCRARCGKRTPPLTAKYGAQTGYAPGVATHRSAPFLPGPAGPGKDSAFAVREKLQTGLPVLEPASIARRWGAERPWSGSLLHRRTLKTGTQASRGWVEYSEPPKGPTQRGARTSNSVLLACVTYRSEALHAMARVHMAYACCIECALRVCS